MKKKLVLFLTIALTCVLTFSSCGLITRIIDSISGEKGTEGLEYTLLEDGTYSVSVGNAKNESEIVIPTKHKGKAVTSISDSAFYDCNSLTSITIGDSVTSIGYYAFCGCDSLTSITVNKNNPTYKSIDGNLYTKDEKTLVQYAIGKNASTFTIPDSVTSIGDRAFYDCNSLTSITIPDSVTSIGDYAFQRCFSLTSISIPDSVTSIGSGAFFFCYNLTSINIPNSVTSIGYSAFEDCDSLTSITIGDSVTSISYGAFQDCDSLTSITIPNSVTSIGAGAFYGCSSLTSITIGDSVTSIGGFAFQACSSLTSITIPDSVTSIGSGAFKDCDSFTIYCEAPEEPSGWNSDWNISNCPVVWDCNNENAEPSYTEGLEYTLLTDGTYAVSVGEAIDQSEIVIPATHEGKDVTVILENGFANCENLVSILIPISVTAIGQDAFYGCDNLTTIFCEATSKPTGFHWSWAPISANIYWYSETQPQGYGAYWHFSNGEITIWE